MPLVTDRSTFLAMPKTGTTFVRDSYKALGLPYRTIEPYHGHALPMQRPTFTWTVARDPLDWLASYYINLRAPDKTVGIAAIDTLRACSGETFEAFVKSYASLLPGYVDRLFELYAGEADYFGSTDALALSVRRALELAGHDELDLDLLDELEPCNVTPFERPIWTDELRALVEVSS